MAGEATQQDFLGMTDEDFLKLNAPAPEAAPEAVEPAAEPAASQEEETGAPVAVDPAEPAAAADPAPVAEPPAEPVAPAPAVPGTEPAAVDPAAPVPGSEPAQDDKDKAPAAEPAGDVKPVDYEAFFQQVMTPFKANGRMVELKSPEEAIRLMQMGAGYGRKMQELQPHLKVLRMLEKNDLLDEGKLSFLIDVNQKNPDAIKKIIKDSGIDPLEINPDDAVDYRPQNHAVSDKELAFHTALAEMQSQPSGLETLQVINQTWDPKSKELLWDRPDVFAVIQTQRENGIYAQIAAEVDRQKLLGVLPPTTPFLEAYTTVGNQMMQAGGFTPPEAPPTTPLPPQPQVLATRTAQPKPAVQHSDKAKAAAPTPSVPHKTTATVNPLQLSDDEFMKQFAGRL